MGILNEKIKELEAKIIELESKINFLAEDRRIQPESRVPLNIDKFQRQMPSTGTGLGKIPGMKDNIIFNDSELKFVPWGTQPSTPNKGYNKHSHSRYAGGALDINTLELVEYDTDEDGDIVDEEGNKLNKHSQSYWKNQPLIAKASDGITDKIGTLDIEFDASSGKWITGSNIIDVERTLLVQYVWKDELGNEVPAGTEGATREIEHSSVLLQETPAPEGETESARVIRENSDLNQSTVVWDSNAGVWRFYAVYADEPEEEPEE